MTIMQDKLHGTAGHIAILYPMTEKFQVCTIGALHQADSTALRVAANAWHDELAPLPKPLLVVNIGGPTSNDSFYLQ